MIPRVFISSTYYDLKHVRERLEKFIENYGFEAILFESDKVTYQHGKPIDQSAYYEVSLCHIMILIIGGRYGTLATSSDIEEIRKRYDEEFVSITRKEFETALYKNIPCFIFIDKNVNSDYETYKENQDFFDEIYSTPPKEAKGKRRFKFAHVDHINVFKFLDLVKTKPIKTFDKVEEIEVYIKNQFSGLFYLYLEGLKKKSDDNKILDTITELNNIALRMNEMLASVGKEILGKDKAEYEKVIENQLLIMLDFYAEKFSSEISFKNQFADEVLEKLDVRSVAEIIYNEALMIEIPHLAKWTKWEELFSFNKLTDKQILTNLQEKLNKVNPQITLERFEYRRLNKELKEKVLPFIKDSKDKNLLMEKLISVINLHLSALPF